MTKIQINCLFEEEFDELYRAFITSKQGEALLDLDGISPRKVNIGRMSRVYFTSDVADVSIDQNANANEGRSPVNYTSEITKGILKLEGYYLLWRYARKRFGAHRANELLWAIWSGYVYFHDASGAGVQQPYCIAFSTAVLMHEGRPYGQLHSLPPKRADSFMAQVIEATMDLSQEFVGAVSPADLLINYCYYAKRDNLSDHEIVNDFQKFVHVVNNQFRVGGQSPFTNVSLFDRENLKVVFGDYVYPDGSKPDFDYIMRVQKLCGEWFAKGAPNGLAYRFPVMTVNLAVRNGKVADEDFLNWVAEQNIERAAFNIYCNEGHKIATCCRLSNDFEEMRNYRVNTFGLGGLNIGSHRVCLVNLPRIARAVSGEKAFYQLLNHYLAVAKDLLVVHREEILRRRIEQGFLKFFDPLQWFTLDMFFSTIGITGVYEMCELWGLDIRTDAGQKFASDVLTHIDNKAHDFSQETSTAFNVEEVPGESAAVTLAKKDELFFGSNEYELYSNQYIPLISDTDPLERICLSGKFMDLTSGGGILHLNVEDKIKNAGQMRKLIEVAVGHGVSHMAINYGYVDCQECGAVTVGGNREKCPECGSEKIDYMTRVIGYYSKVSAWNETRRNYEFPRRDFIKQNQLDERW